MKILRIKRVSLLPLLITLVSTTISIPVHSSEKELNDEQFSVSQLFTPEVQKMKDRLGVLIDENVSTLRMPTMLFGYNWKGNSPPNAVAICDSLTDTDCTQASFFMYYSLFQPCQNETDTDCIEEFFAISKDGSRHRGTVQQAIPSQVAHPYQPNTRVGLPRGGNASVWTLPSVTHKGGTNEYAILVSRVGSVARISDTFIGQAPGSNPWVDGDFRIAIYPVKLDIHDLYRENQTIRVVQESGNYAIGINHPSRKPWEACALLANGVCALRQPFPEDVQFGLKVRFSSAVNGWIHGRVKDPTFDYSIEPHGVTISMLGQAKKVPILAGYFDGELLESDARRARPDLFKPGNFSYPSIHDLNAFTIYNKILGDKAIAVPSQWSFYNSSPRTLASSHSCISRAENIAGFISTNAATYDLRPPIFNTTSQTLDYQVAAPHLLPNGEVLQGEYDLQIQSEVARCIYGFSKAPITASVSITRDSETVRFVSSAMSESDDWIKLSVGGFTYSNPVIGVRLIQAESPTQEEKSPLKNQPTVDSETVISQPSVIAPKKLKECKKGKKSIQIFTIKKCPKGFKRQK